MRKSLRSRNNGLTLVELLLSAAISAITVIAATSFFAQTSKQNSNFIKEANNTISKRITAIYLNNIIPNAGLSHKYQHMPIPMDRCDQINSTPCLRQLDPTDMKFMPYVYSGNLIHFKDGLGASSYGATYYNTNNILEFFRDKFGALHREGNCTTSMMCADKNLDAQPSDAAFSGNYYMTWPLIDDHSPPFIMMVKSQDNLLLTYKDVYQTYAPAGTSLQSFCSPTIKGFNLTTAQPYTFFFSPENTTSITNVSNLVGKLALVYNPEDPDAYTVQAIKDIKSCTGSNKTACFSALTSDFTSYNTSFNPDLTIPTNQNVIPNGDYILKLYPVSTGQSTGLKSIDVPTNSIYHGLYTGENDGYEPKLNPSFYSAPAGSTITPPNQISTDKNPLNFPTLLDSAAAPFQIKSDTTSLFATTYFTKYKVSSVINPAPATGYGTPATNKFNFIQNLYRYESCRLNSPLSLNLIPFELRAFYIRKKGNTSLPCGNTNVECSLWMSTFKSGTGTAGVDTETRIMEKLTGSVIIARKIGSSSIGIFSYEGFTNNDWLKPRPSGGPSQTQ